MTVSDPAIDKLMGILAAKHGKVAPEVVKLTTELTTSETGDEPSSDSKSAPLDHLDHLDHLAEGAPTNRRYAVGRTYRERHVDCIRPLAGDDRRALLAAGFPRAGIVRLGEEWVVVDDITRLMTRDTFLVVALYEAVATECAPASSRKKRGYQ